MHEQQFSLIYNSKGGITYRDVLEMPVKERAWFLERLSTQITDENKAREKASKTATPKKKPSFRRSRKR